MKHLTPECGTASGNWGLLDLDGNGSKFVGGLFANGYHKAVKKSADPAVCEEAEGDELESCFNASPGAKWNAGPIKSAPEFLDGTSSCEDGSPEFFVPTYDTVLGPNGKNAKFPLTGYARVQLMCFTVGSSHLNSLTLNFIEFSPDECCSGVSEKNRVLEICDVGTISGALGADYESSCGTPSDAPPTLEAGCKVNAIDPPERDVIVDGSGYSTEPLVVEVTVDDMTKWGDLRLRAVVHDTEIRVVAPVPATSGNTPSYTYASGTQFATGGMTLMLVVYEDDFVWDQSATVRTVLDDGSAEETPTCAIESITQSDMSIGTYNDQGTKRTSKKATWTVEFAWPSQLRLRAGSHRAERRRSRVDRCRRGERHHGRSRCPWVPPCRTAGRARWHR